MCAVGLLRVTSESIALGAQGDESTISALIDQYWAGRFVKYNL